MSRTIRRRRRPVESAGLQAVDDTLPAVWVSGQRQPSGAPHLSVRDRGFALADGVFETMRVQSGKIFRFDRHLARLLHALGVLDIAAPPELGDWVLDAVAAAGRVDASLRLTVTRGLGDGSLVPSSEMRPTVVVTVSARPAFPLAVYETGLIAHVASGRRNERSMTGGLKTLAYTDAIAGLIEAKRAGAEEALFLDTEGHCSEAASSNLFAWTGRSLLTPPLTCGALPGITRATVLELANALGVASAEQAFGLDELLNAEEAFLTSSLRGLAPLVGIGAHPIGSGAPGVFTRRLADAYTAAVAHECGASVAPAGRAAERARASQR